MLTKMLSDLYLEKTQPINKFVVTLYESFVVVLGGGR